MLDDLQIAQLLAQQYDGTLVSDYAARIGEVSFAVKRYSDCTAVLFEGSFNIPDWWSNLQALMVTVPRIGRIDQGFNDDMAETIADIIPRLQPGLPTYIGGHSRGAAHTNVAAAYLIDQGWDRKSIIRTTIAPPRTGNADFAKFLQGSPGTAYRNYHNEVEQDFVVCVPIHFKLEPYVAVDPWTVIYEAPALLDPWLLLRFHHLNLYQAGIAKLFHVPCGNLMNV